MAKNPREIELGKRRARIKNIVATAGGQSALADQLGVTQAAVSKWVVQGFVPLRRAAEIEALYGTARMTIVNPTISGLLSDTEFAPVA